MAEHLNRLYEHVTDRLLYWRTLRWSKRLAELDCARFEATISQMLLDAEASAPKAAAVDDLELAAAIAELSLPQRTLLYLLKQGTTYHEIAVTLGMSDEYALRELTILLRKLLTKALRAAEDADLPH